MSDLRAKFMSFGKMELSEEEWVNADRMIAESTTLILVVLGVNPLFLGGLHLTFFSMNSVLDTLTLS